MLFGKSGKGKMVIIIALAAVAVLAGVGVVVLKNSGKKHGKPEKLPTVEMALGEFIVNLADKNEVRYVKANIVLEVEGELPAASGEGKGEGGDPRIRDAVIQIMSSKHFSELADPKGKEKLKKEIIIAVNERFAENAERSDKGKETPVKAVEVFFSEFAMQ
ncbi:MAG: flagellar basal body-associated FliL family protein [Armatimonadetes bacterium]|nr:flagellar basal body-associated FliL family protein [Armatimonadota bacterium]